MSCNREYPIFTDELIIIYCRIIRAKHAEWHRHRWSETDISELYSETDHQLYLLSTLPLAVVKEWDIYKHTVEVVRVVQTSAPMVEGLRRLGRVSSPPPPPLSHALLHLSLSHTLPTALH